MQSYIELLYAELLLISNFKEQQFFIKTYNKKYKTEFTNNKNCLIQ